MVKTLGTFEQAVLRAVVNQKGEGYGMTIRQEVAEASGREISIGAIYTTLLRLEAKGMVSSLKGEPTEARGGRAKTFFKIEAEGASALQRAREEMLRTWTRQPAWSS